MTESELILWDKIRSFQLDNKTDHFKFSDRLSRENGWSKDYTFRVIEEYKRFIFLCCVSETGVTPSDPVDQAWHLHLTYTKSYWVDLCKNTLAKEIHHNPTKGGEKEAEKFDSFYTQLRKLYFEKFNEEPPADIWQNNKIRFSDINFQRVNLSNYWLVRKPGFTIKKQLTLLFIILAGIVSIQATTKYLPVFFICILLAVIIIVAVKNQRKENTNNNSGDSGSGGCNSDSGCSGSGCSGCGGGD